MLERALTLRLGRRVNIWRDHKLAGNGPFFHRNCRAIFPDTHPDFGVVAVLCRVGMVSEGGRGVL